MSPTLPSVESLFDRNEILPYDLMRDFGKAFGLPLSKVRVLGPGDRDRFRVRATAGASPSSASPRMPPAARSTSGANVSAYTPVAPQ